MNAFYFNPERRLQVSLHIFQDPSFSAAGPVLLTSVICYVCRALAVTRTGLVAAA